VLSPPQITVNAASGFNLTAVQLTATGLTGQFVEWEIVPIDIADWPEAYRALTAGSQTTYCCYVRPGYNYHARARAVSGAPGPWTAPCTISAIGSPGGTGAGAKSYLTTQWPQVIDTPGPGITAATLDSFPNVTPDWVLETEDAAAPKAVLGTTGHERLSASQIRPRRGFKLMWQDRLDPDVKLVRDFWDFCQARSTPFYWTHPTTAEIFVCRFDADDYDVPFSGFSADKGAALEGLSIPLVEAVVNQIPTYPFRFLANSSL
jgi:hypothetical protein